MQRRRHGGIDRGQDAGLKPAGITNLAWLAELPVLEFRAFASLALFAIMARRAKVGGDHNPGLIILGPTQRLKSTLIKILCYLAGSTPEACGIQMQSVRARGLIGRLNGKGVLGDTNPTLQEPIVWLEETSLAEPGVYRDVTALLQGSSVVKIESNEVHIPAVPIIEMNPLVDTGNLEERTGMDLPRLRRVILLDTTKLEITPIVRRNAKDLLEYFKALGPIRLDDAPRTPLSAGAAEHLDQAITACIRPSGLTASRAAAIATMVANLISKPVPLPEVQDDSCDIMFDNVHYSILISQVPTTLDTRL